MQMIELTQRHKERKICFNPKHITAISPAYVRVANGEYEEKGTWIELTSSFNDDDVHVVAEDYELVKTMLHNIED